MSYVQSMFVHLHHFEDWEPLCNRRIFPQLNLRSHRFKLDNTNSSTYKPTVKRQAGNRERLILPWFINYLLRDVNHLDTSGIRGIRVACVEGALHQKGRKTATHISLSLSLSKVIYIADLRAREGEGEGLVRGQRISGRRAYEFPFKGTRCVRGHILPPSGN